MQTDQRFRLLRKNTATKSGYEIAGYARMRYDEERKMMVTEHARKIAWGIWTEVAPNMIDDYQNWIRHDAVDLGIKVGDKWWFEGDMFKCELLFEDEDVWTENHTGVLVYGDAYWKVVFGERRMMFDSDNMKLVGSIHEIGELS